MCLSTRQRKLTGGVALKLHAVRAGQNNDGITFEILIYILQNQLFALKYTLKHCAY